MEELKPTTRNSSNSSRLPVLHTWPSLDNDLHNENDQELKGRRSVGGKKNENNSNKMIVSVSENGTETIYSQVTPTRRTSKYENGSNSHSENYSSRNIEIQHNESKYPALPSSPSNISDQDSNHSSNGHSSSLHIAPNHSPNNTSDYGSLNNDHQYHQYTNHYHSPSHIRESNKNSISNNRYSNDSISVSSSNSIYGSRKDYPSPAARPSKQERRTSASSSNRSHSPDAGVHLDCSFGLDKHVDVHAEPLYSYIKESPSHYNYENNQKNSRDHEPIRPPSTPGRTPRGSTLTVSSPTKKNERWC